MIDLKQFCHFDHEMFLAPFSLGGFSYATNGHVLVRVGRRDDVPENSAAALPLSSNRLPFDHDQIEDWKQFPVEHVKKEKCEDCNGGGFVADCYECKGAGWHQFGNSFNDYEICCKTCDGDGLLAAGKEKSGGDLNHRVCRDCEGSGYVVRYRAIDVGRNDHDGLNSVYAELFNRLPGAVFSTYGEKFSCFRAKFDGGVGLIMPMRMS